MGPKLFRGRKRRVLISGVIPKMGVFGDDENGKCEEYSQTDQKIKSMKIFWDG